MALKVISAGYCEVLLSIYCIGSGKCKKTATVIGKKQRNNMIWSLPGIGTRSGVLW
jgi:hypothetical protein